MCVPAVFLPVRLWVRFFLRVFLNLVYNIYTLLLFYINTGECALRFSGGCTLQMFRIPYPVAGFVSALRVVTVLTLSPAPLSPNNIRSLEAILGTGVNSQTT